MLQFSRFQTIAILGLIVLAGLFALPNFLSEEQRANLPGFMPKNAINLGLDLQGGSHLLLVVDTDDVDSKKLTALRKDIQTALRPRRSVGRERVGTKSVDVDLTEWQIVVNLNDAEQLDEALKRIRPLTRQTASVGGGLGLGGQVYDVTGSEKRVTIAMTTEGRATSRTEAVGDSIEVIRRRIDPAGNKEVSIQPQGANRIVLQVPGADDPEAIEALINRTGQLSFHAANFTVQQPPLEEGWGPFLEDGRTCREVTGLPPGLMLREYAEEEQAGATIILETDEVISGSNVNSASMSPNNDGGGFQINFTFDATGGRKFASYTSENIGGVFAIVLDCRVISAPTIQSAITGGSGRITGSFSAEEALRVSTLIRSGALPAPLQTIERRTVSATLGQDSIEAGRIAIIVGFVAVIFYMLISYGRFGVYANLALITNIVLIAGALSLFGSTLTLPGIAGIVLTIGMAVDANVLIFERIREELRNGKGPIMAVETGFQRARSAIIDANITTFLAAFIMFFLGAGPVRGFAVTLAIGVVTSVFTAYVVTRLFAGGWLLSKRPKEIKL